MLKYCLFLMLGCFVMVPAWATPVARWAANGDTLDELGQNHGSFVGSAQFTQGVAGEAFSLNGSNYVKVVNDSSLDVTGEITITAWINPSSLGSYQAVLWNAANGGFASGDKLEFGVRSNGTLQFSPTSVGEVRPTRVSSSSLVVQAGQFNHVAAVAASDGIEMYINGQLVFSDTTGNNIISSNRDWTIGAEEGGSLRFVGAIDDVQVHAGALSQQDIVDVMNNTSVAAVPEPGCWLLVALALCGMVARVRS